MASFLSLPNGIPRHDTLARVFAKLAPEAFEKCFRNWIDSLIEMTGSKVIPIEGKTLRGSYDREAKQKFIGVVSAQGYFILNMRFNQEQSNKLGMKNKRLKAAWDEKYLEKVLNI